jgi:hypothetical protein
MRALAPLLCTLVLTAFTVAGPALANDVCVVGTVTVSQPNDPGFEGLYKYCVTATWDVGQFGLSHIDFFLELENCECACEEGVVQFPTPAGTSDGVPEPCTVEYAGEYLCMGDPTVPEDMNGPAVKYDAIPGECEPGSTGTGTWCFYSPFPPAPASTHTSAIKHGGEICYGVVTGSLPMCDCSTPTHHSTFGRIKVSYR